MRGSSGTFLPSPDDEAETRDVKASGRGGKPSDFRWVESVGGSARSLLTGEVRVAQPQLGSPSEVRPANAWDYAWKLAL